MREKVRMDNRITMGILEGWQIRFGCGMLKKAVVIISITFIAIGSLYAKDYRPILKLPNDVAISELKSLAESGDNQAAYLLALLLRDSGKTDTDNHDATYWFKLAASQGNIHAMFELGYQNFYTAETNISCGQYSVTINTYCDPFDKNEYRPLCYKQSFVFKDPNGIIKKNMK